MTASDLTVEIPAVQPEVKKARRRSERRRRPPTSSPKRASRPLSQGTRTMLWVLAALVLVALWVVSYALGLSAIEQNASQRVLYSGYREALAEATAPTGGEIEPGTPVAVMTAPGLGLENEVVVEGTTSAQTQLGPGHSRSTPLPGQAGVSVIFGRGVTFGSPFRDLGEQVSGSQITFTTGQGSFVYEIDGVRRPGDPLPAVMEPGEGRLMLVSAEGDGPVRSLAVQANVFLDATLIDKPAETSGGRPAVVGADELPNKGDRSALIPLTFWLEALLLTSVGLVWARVRWGSWQVWVIGVPVLIALLWGSTSTAFVLLPNLL